MEHQDPDQNDLWRFAIDRYGRAGVSEKCLELQDRFDADVCVVLFCLWMGQQGFVVTTETLETIENGPIGSWHRDVVRRLRHARRAMKRPPENLDHAVVELERQRIKAAELAAEKLQLAMLAQLAPAPGDRVGRIKHVALDWIHSVSHLVGRSTRRTVQVDVVHRPSPSDKVGAHQMETRRAGPIRANSIGRRLVRAASPNHDKTLDLATNRRRQNGSNETRRALDSLPEENLANYFAKLDAGDGPPASGHSIDLVLLCID